MLQTRGVPMPMSDHGRKILTKNCAEFLPARSIKRCNCTFLQILTSVIPSICYSLKAGDSLRTQLPRKMASRMCETEKNELSQSIRDVFRRMPSRAHCVVVLGERIPYRTGGQKIAVASASASLCFWSLHGNAQWSEVIESLPLGCGLGWVKQIRLLSDYRHGIV